MQDLLVLYEGAALSVGQLPPKLLVLQQVQEMKTVWVSETEGKFVVF